MASLSTKLFFSWLEVGKLAALAWPGTKAAVEFLRSHEISWLVSLTEQPPSLHGVSGLKCVHIPVPDLKPPTIEQVQEFIDITEKAIENREAVAVHCQYGCGRTGTMIACYFVKTTNCTAAEAAEKVRRMRPGSIETPEQEHLIELYEKYLKIAPTKNK